MPISVERVVHCLLVRRRSKQALAHAVVFIVDEETAASCAVNGTRCKLAIEGVSFGLTVRSFGEFDAGLLRAKVSVDCVGVEEVEGEDQTEEEKEKGREERNGEERRRVAL